MNRTRLGLPTLLFAASAGLAAAGEPPKVTKPTPHTPPTAAAGEDAAKLAADNATFAFDLLKLLGKSDGNILFSPQSVTTSVAMVSVGAEGPTAASLTRAFRWSLAGDKLYGAFGTLAGMLEPPAEKDRPPAYTWTQANRMWVLVPVREGFAASLRKHFGADAGKLAGNPQSDADAINAWTSDNTRGRICKLVQPSDLKDARLVLTNAVYFKGAWVSPFSPAATTPRDFKLAGGETVQAPMMTRTTDYRYAKAKDLAMVQIPYEGGISFVVILPDEGKFAKVAESLTEPLFSASIKDSKWSLVDLRLPKLKFQSRRSLGGELVTLGADQAFSDRAKFPGIAAEPLKIGEVIHVADIELDEKGAEAAAATATSVPPAAARPGPPPPPPKIIPFHADRPFFFAIRHDATGAILFAGRVADPR